MSTTFNDITQLIRVKEQELQEIHNLRCSQLEKMVDERDKIILDIAKKFESLRDDFNFNLSLLEARDVEIIKLETVVTEKTKYIGECDDNIRALNQKVDLLERKNCDMNDRFGIDKKNSKKLLNELKDAIEALKWSAEESDRSKSHEIDKLKLELANFRRDKDESMELQRQDLISTFDSIIAQKEAALASKEKEVVDQVLTLEIRLETLLNENMKLKSSMADSKRVADHLREDNLARQDSIRQLQWKLEDEIKGKLVLEERLSGNVSNSKAELDTLKESILKSDFTHKLEKEKLSNEVDRLRDNYQSQVDMLGEYKKASMSSISRLELELLESQNREDRLRAELSNCLITKDIENEKSVSLKSHLDLVVSRFSILEKENASYHNENMQIKRQLSEAKDAIEYKLREANEIADERLRQSQIEFTKTLSTIQQVATEKSSNFESYRQIEGERINAIAAEYASKLKQLEDSKQDQHEVNLSSLKSEIDHLHEQLMFKNKELDDEKAETAAVRLRLQLYEKSYVSSASSQPNNFMTSQMLQSRLRGGIEDEEGGKKRALTSHSVDNSNDEIIGSPMFSDDFGSVSIPNSPMVSFMNDKDTSYLSLNEKEAFQNSPNDRNRPSNLKLENNYQSSPPKISEESLRIKALVDENQRLKAIVKEMRSDVESLQFQVVDYSKVGDIGGSLGDNERIRSLEKRLEQTIEEVARLRKERSRLMDIGNELRAALYKKEIEMLGDDDNNRHVSNSTAAVQPSLITGNKSSRSGVKYAWSGSNKNISTNSNKDDGGSNSSEDSKDVDNHDALQLHSDSSAKENDLANSLLTKAIAMRKLPAGKADRFSSTSSSNSSSVHKLVVAGKPRQMLAKAPRKVMNYATAAKDTPDNDE